MHCDLKKVLLTYQQQVTCWTRGDCRPTATYGRVHVHPTPPTAITRTVGSQLDQPPPVLQATRATQTAGDEDCREVDR